jgi:hypothetical protein
MQVARPFVTWMLDSLSGTVQVAKLVFTRKLGTAAVGRSKLIEVRVEIALLK